MRKVCRVCHIEQDETQYWRLSRNGLAKGTICKSCARAQLKHYHSRVREKVLRIYGGACECCMESRKEFLTIDHQDGTTATSRGKNNTSAETSRKIYKARKRLPKTRLLCYNCNCSIGFLGYCPHEKERGDAAKLIGAKEVER